MINVSETDSAHKTTQDPLLPDGTTHGFVRRPTHLGSMRIASWILHNHVVKPQCYIVNCFESPTFITRAAWSAEFFLRSRPDARIINIHADQHDDMKFGSLNTYTKWPTFFPSALDPQRPNRFDFDHFAAQQNRTSLRDRNWFYRYWKEQFPFNARFNWEEYQVNHDQTLEWYQVRNRLQPWEVNETEYTARTQLPRSQVLDINICEILESNFIDSVFAPWIDQQAIGQFDWRHAQQYHQKYISHQVNLQWFDSIRRMREHKHVDDFLLKNDLSQAFVLMELENLQDIVPDWETLTITRILDQFGISHG